MQYRAPGVPPVGEHRGSGVSPEGSENHNPWRKRGTALPATHLVQGFTARPSCLRDVPPDHRKITNEIYVHSRGCPSLTPRVVIGRCYPSLTPRVVMGGRLASVLFGMLLLCGFCGIASAQLPPDEIPKNLHGVGVDEKLGEDIPLDLEFTNDQGARVTFGKLLEDKRPILLSLNYSDCPGLCITQLNGITQGVNDVSGLKLGADFKMVSLSIDPSESIKKAAATKARYAEDLEKRHSVDGWHFLTGSERNIRKLADSVGFRYTYDSKNKQFNHSAAAIFISPNGRITRYLYEVGFIRGETIRMALLEAGEGRIGTSLDAFVLWCSHYDPNENRYSASARILLSVVAGGFVIIGLVALLPYWLSQQKRRSLQNDLLVNERDNSSRVSGQDEL